MHEAWQDDFDGWRQARETHNEVGLNLLRAAVMLAALAVQLVLSATAWRPTNGLMLAEAALVLAAFGVHPYLRAPLFYVWWRKYAIAGFEALAVFVLLVALRGGGGVGAGPFLPVAVFMLLIVLAGLRYSPRLVLFIGGLAVVLHLVLAATGRPSVPRFPVVLIGSLLLAGAAGGLAYGLGSLLSRPAERGSPQEPKPTQAVQEPQPEDGALQDESSG